MEEKIKNFSDLEAWKEGHKLVLMVYEMTKVFPKEEIFGLSNQLRRAVVSITSNIAEGFSRYSKKEKIQFYSIALRSLTEVQSQTKIAKDVQYISNTHYEESEKQTITVSRLINGLIKFLRSNP